MVAINPIPPFAFYLVNAAGDSYYVDFSGPDPLVRTRGLPTPIEFSPDGWESMTIGWERNLDKLGLVRAFSLTLGFIGDAAIILEWISNRKNIDEKVWLLVQKLDLEVTADDYALVHKFYYKGEIDLSTYRKVQRKVLCNIMEGGRSKELAANQATNYTFPLATDPDRIRVLFDGMNLENKALFAVTNGTPTADPFWNYQNHIFELVLIRKEVDDIGAASPTFRTKVANNNTSIRATTGWGFKASVAGIVTIDYDFTILIEYDPAAPGINPAAVVKVVARPINTANIAVTQLEMLATGAGVLVPGLYHVVGTGTLAVGVGDEIYPFTFCNVQGATGDTQLRFTYGGDEPVFSIKYLFRFPPTFVWMLRPSTVFSRLVGKISGDEAFAVSELLSTLGICFTSGDGLRRIDTAGLVISMDTFYEIIKKLKFAGLGVEAGKIVLELITHFLNDDVIIDLGEVTGQPEIEPAIEFMYNTIKAGYEDQKVDDLNGKINFNTLQEWTTPLKRVVKELNLVVPARADPFGQESIRANLEGKTTTDAQSDNQVFIDNVDLDNPQVDANGTYYNLKRAAYTAVEGLIDPASAYNIEELTPKRIMNTWKTFFRGMLWKFDGQNIHLETSARNSSLATHGGPGGDVIENSDISIALCGDPLFGPKKIGIRIVGPLNLYLAMTNTPAACFRFTRNGGTFKGFSLKVAQACKTNAAQQYSLLSHPDNDLTLLENG